MLCLTVTHELELKYCFLWHIITHADFFHNVEQEVKVI